LIGVRRFLVAVVVTAVAWIPGQSFLLFKVECEFSWVVSSKIIDEVIGCVEVALVEYVGDVGEVVAFTSALNVMLDYGTVALLRVLEAVIAVHCVFVEVVVGKADVLLDNDKEGELQAVFPLVNHKGRLLLSHVEFILRFIIEGNLQ
jgi:hypothetical protein